MRLRLEDLFEEYGLNKEQTKKFWIWLRKKEIYGIFIENIEFEPQYHDTDVQEYSNKDYIDHDASSNLDVDAIYFKTFGYKGQRKNGSKAFHEFTLRDVLTELEIPFE